MSETTTTGRSRPVTDSDLTTGTVLAWQTWCGPTTATIVSVRRLQSGEPVAVTVRSADGHTWVLSEATYCRPNLLENLAKVGVAA